MTQLKNLMSSRVFIRKPTEADYDELLSLRCRNKDFHFPWVILTLNEKACYDYIHRCQNDNFQGLLICYSSTNKIIGIVNLSQIFYGGFQNAYLSYYADIDYAGRGLMSEGVRLAIDYAFYTLHLHRLEANIQPGNKTSISLVKRLNFTKEGFSPKYLNINGAWRDHERWALTVENW